MVGLGNQPTKRPKPPTIWGLMAAATAERQSVILRNVGHPSLRAFASSVGRRVKAVNYTLHISPTAPTAATGPAPLSSAFLPPFSLSQRRHLLYLPTDANDDEAQSVAAIAYED